MSRRLVDCLLILLNARAYLNIAIESRFAPMMLLAVFKKVQYKLLMHRLAQMNVRFALMNSKRCIKSVVHRIVPHKYYTTVLFCPLQHFFDARVISLALYFISTLSKVHLKRKLQQMFHAICL